MAMDPAHGSESGSDFSQPTENLLFRAWSKVTRRTSRPIPDSAEATSGPIIEDDGAEVTRRPPSTISISPPPSFIPARQAPLPPATESQSTSEDGVTRRASVPILCGAQVTRRIPPLTMPILPPPIFIPIGQASLPSAMQSQSISGDQNPYKDIPRGPIPCLRCKENSIDCHGPETKYYGDCSKCHDAGKRCEFEAHVLDVPSSLLNLQHSAIDDGIPQPTSSTNNDDRTHIDNPNSQLDTSSSRQSYQNPPIKDPSRDPETSNLIGGITNNDSISDKSRIKPWWKSIFSRIFCSR